MMLSLGQTTPTVAPYTAPTPSPTAAQTAAAIAQAQTSYNTRSSGCQAYDQQMYLVAAGVGGAMLLMLPGMWSALGLVAGIGIVALYPRSPDCDYGF